MNIMIGTFRTDLKSKEGPEPMDVPVIGFKSSLDNFLEEE